MKDTSFLLTNSKISSEAYVKNRVFQDEYISLFLNSKNENHIVFSPSLAGFRLFIGAINPDFKKPNDEASLSPGTVISYDSSSRKLLITTDRLGTAIVFYETRNSREFSVSNRLENLGIIEREKNWSAIQQYLNTGYTIGSDTFFEGISQTLPAQTLSLEINPPLRVEESIRGFQQEFLDLSPEELEQKIISRLTSLLQELPKSTLMMSAGWDSRTLLAQGAKGYKSAYTHGDLSSREILISHKLSRRFRLDHHFIDTENQNFTPTLLDEMLAQLGFCIFPIWYLAAQRVQALNGGPLSSGVLGELLGGHYGLLSIGTRFHKLMSASSILVGGDLSDQQMERRVAEFCTPPEYFWFLTDDALSHFNKVAPKTKARMLDQINRFRSEEANWQRAIERFNMNHRARQYILKQAQASVSTVGYIAPFADDILAETSEIYPFKNRIHNKLNRRILSELNPVLLNEPMAATLISAKRPIIFQEISRVLRVFFEESTKLLGISPPRLGWFDYEYLYTTTLFEHWITSLKHEIWDKDRMRSTIKSNVTRGIDAGSTLDMLCKIKTVDHYIS